MLEGVLYGMAGAGTVAVAHWTGKRVRPGQKMDRKAGFSISSIPSFLKSCVNERVQSTRELFSECKAEWEAK